jgi:hypothetical protein
MSLNSMHYFEYFHVRNKFQTHFPFPRLYQIPTTRTQKNCFAAVSKQRFIKVYSACRHFILSIFAALKLVYALNVRRSSC